MRVVHCVAFAALLAGCSNVNTNQIPGGGSTGSVTLTSVVPSQGPLAGNVPVVLTGTGFTAASLAVSFGGNAATGVTFVNATTVKATVPAATAAGSVAVKLTCGAGSFSLPSSFTYASTAAITITSITPSNGPVTGGTEVAIVGSGFSSGTPAITFGSTAGTNVAVVDDGHLTVVTPAAAAAGVVSVTIADNAGSVSLPNSYTYGTVVTAPSTTPESLDGLSEIDNITQYQASASATPSISGDAVYFATASVSYPTTGTCALDLNATPTVTSTLNAGSDVVITVAGGGANTLTPTTVSSGITEYELTNGAVSDWSMGGMASVQAPGVSGGVAAFNVPSVAQAPASTFSAWLDILGLTKFSGGGLWSKQSDQWLSWSDDGTFGDAIQNPVNHIQVWVIGNDASNNTHTLQCDIRGAASDNGTFCIRGGGSSDICQTPGNTMSDFYQALGSPAIGAATIVLYRGNRSDYAVGSGSAALDVNVIQASSLLMSN